MNILHVIGARPNLMKCDAVLRAMSSRHQNFVVHTGQHYDREMGALAVQTDFNLGCGEAPPEEKLPRMIELLTRYINRRQGIIDYGFVYGDVTSTLAGALAFMGIGIRIAHVEAGLRSWDKHQPEENVRVIVDHVSDILFAPERRASQNLVDERCRGANLFVGNTMIDSLKWLIDTRQIDLSLTEMQKPFILVTLHRPSNVDDGPRFKALLEAIESLTGLGFDVLWPLHPRARRVRDVTVGRKIKYLNPLPYSKFIGLLSKAELMITDSGGVQEEACYLQVPCITVRKCTERIETMSHGNILAPTPGKVAYLAKNILGDTRYIGRRSPQGDIPLWDGRAGRRIADIMDRVEHHGSVLNAELADDGISTRP